MKNIVKELLEPCTAVLIFVNRRVHVNSVMNVRSCKIGQVNRADEIIDTGGRQAELLGIALLAAYIFTTKSYRRFQ